MSRSKYGVAPAEERTYKGILFHSKREMEAYRGFEAMERSGAIQKLERQVKYSLYAAYFNGISWEPRIVAMYIADFRITELDGTVRIYESKGYSTAEYKLKKKLFEATYPNLRIVEI